MQNTTNSEQSEWIYTIGKVYNDSKERIGKSKMMHGLEGVICLYEIYSTVRDSNPAWITGVAI